MFARCDSRDNAPEDDSNYALETYGKGSRCFKQVIHALHCRDQLGIAYFYEGIN